tara:strand:+ start:704 stop:871 length:168 start_codon:yes stop_codon:yes gene_type:complete
MSEQSKRFFVGKKPDGKKEVAWNWPHNINAEIYPEYVSWEGPFDTRVQAEERAST